MGFRAEVGGVLEGGLRVCLRRASEVACNPGEIFAVVVFVSIVVSIPACHAGDRGSIPRRGDVLSF